jgi:hypothetical protein
VAFQWVRSAVGKAEMPGVGEVMRPMSSDCRLCEGIVSCLAC